MASVAELKEKHAAATASVNSLRERLRQRRQTLLDTDGEAPPPSLPPPAGSCRGFVDGRAVEKYSKAQGRTAVTFNQMDRLLI